VLFTTKEFTAKLTGALKAKEDYQQQQSLWQYDIANIFRVNYRYRIEYPFLTTVRAAQHYSELKINK